MQILVNSNEWVANTDKNFYFDAPIKCIYFNYMFFILMNSISNDRLFILIDANDKLAGWLRRKS